MDGFARGKRKSSMSASFEVKPVPRNAKRGRGNLYRKPIEFYGECCSRKRDLICQGNSRELNVQIGPKVSSHLFFYLFFFFFWWKKMEHQNWKEKLVLLISSQIYVQTWFFSLFLSNVDRQSVRKFALLLVKSDFWLVLYWIWTYIYFLQTRWYLSKLSFFFAFNSHSRDAVFRSLSLFERREKEREREKSPWKIENHSVGSIGPIERACSSMVSGARKFLRGTRTVYRGFLSSDVSRLACVSMKQQREREREKKNWTTGVVASAYRYMQIEFIPGAIRFYSVFADSAGLLVSNFYQPIQPGRDLIRYVLLRVSECPGWMNFVEAASHHFSLRLRCFRCPHVPPFPSLFLFSLLLLANKFNSRRIFVNSLL